MTLSGTDGSPTAPVYISARPRQRRKAFRLRWMRLIDEHWIAYPEFLAGALGVLERLKLALLQRPTVRYLDVMLTAARGAVQESMLARLGFAVRTYVLVVPGGGTGHPGARGAMLEFVAVARGLAARGVDTILVGQAPAADDHSAPSAARNLAAVRTRGIDARRATRHRERRLDAAASHRLRQALHRGADRRRPA